MSNGIHSTAEAQSTFWCICILSYHDLFYSSETKLKNDIYFALDMNTIETSFFILELENIKLKLKNAR